MRFEEDELDSDLQKTIRDNLYERTVPCKYCTGVVTVKHFNLNPNRHHQHQNNRNRILDKISIIFLICRTTNSLVKHMKNTSYQNVQHIKCV